MEKKITKKQIALIHTAISRLGISDDNYRDMLSGYGVKSAKELSPEKATAVIAALGRMGFKIIDKRPAARSGSRKGNPDYANGKARATEPQLRKIEAMWMSSPRVEKKDREALQSFCKRITGVDRLEWLTQNLVKKLIMAIERLS